MSNQIVLDASALTEALTAADPDPSLMKRILTSNAFAPEIIYLETLSTIRKHVRRGEMSPEMADRATAALPHVHVSRASHYPHLSRIWELRHAITPYDAAYVALAEKLDLPLVTCDAKLAGSNSHKATIEVYPTS